MHETSLITEKKKILHEKRSLIPMKYGTHRISKQYECNLYLNSRYSFHAHRRWR